ncbi:hypothetical protein [Streptomyces sp. NRRL WC-3742]|uniref:hypothetical protein n=1 Tax=Streptomyces sp. NRRL WC-3742 TaxID=1463934 RepID=UPI0004CB9C4C|nr:hypothetical protein [Streptomyces sp. NRRL WC-3742]
MSAEGGVPVPTVTTRGFCATCRRHVTGRLLVTVDERWELVEHDDCPGERPRQVRARTHHG